MTNLHLKASATSFYLWRGAKQALPCTSWTPGSSTCEIRWLKEDPVRQPLVLNYSLSTNEVSTDSEFGLTDDFGLVIQSVNEDHAGGYSCATDSVTKNLDVYVIGRYGLILITCFNSRYYPPQ